MAGSALIEPRGLYSSSLGSGYNYNSGLSLNSYPGLGSYSDTGIFSSAGMYPGFFTSGQYYMQRARNMMQTQKSYQNLDIGSEAVIDQLTHNFYSHLSNGSEKKALETYNALLEEMKKQERYKGLEREITDENGNKKTDDSRLRAAARTLMEGKLGVNIENEIKRHADSNFEKSAKLFSFDGDDITRTDLLKDICNYDEKDVTTKLEKGGGMLCKGALIAMPAALSIGALSSETFMSAAKKNASLLAKSKFIKGISAALGGPAGIGAGIAAAGLALWLL